MKCLLFRGRMEGGSTLGGGARFMFVTAPLIPTLDTAELNAGGSVSTGFTFKPGDSLIILFGGRDNRPDLVLACLFLKSSVLSFDGRSSIESKNPNSFAL